MDRTGWRLISSSTWPRSMSASNAGLIGSTRDTMTPSMPFGRLKRCANSRIDLAHRQAERRSGIARRLRLVAVGSLPLAQRTLGQLHRHVQRPAVAHDLQRGHRARLTRRDGLNQLVVADDRLAVDGDDHVIGAKAGACARRAGGDVLHERAGRRLQAERPLQIRHRHRAAPRRCSRATRGPSRAAAAGSRSPG